MNPLYIVMIIVCILSSLSVFAHMLNSPVLSKKSKLWFSHVFLGICLGALMEMLGDYMTYSGLAPRLHWGVKLLEFCVTPWLPVYMALACGLEKQTKPIAVLMGLHMLLEICCLPLGKIIFIDENSVYHRGEWYYIYIFFYAVSFIYLLIAFNLLSKQFRNRDRVTLCMSVVTLLAALIPSLISSSFRTGFFASTMTGIILFMYYEGLTEQELADDLAKRNQRINNMQTRTIVGVADLIESRDANTGTHIKNTSRYVEKLTRAARDAGVYADQIDDHFIYLMRQTAPLHDVGKITIPDAILLKPGKLDQQEFEVMKTHAEEGGKIILHILGGVTDEEYTEIAYNVASFHHEKWNGKGYPLGLAGEKIPLCARIMAIADVYDALTMERVYKKAFSQEKALAIIEEDSGIHFDPLLAPVFVKMVREESAHSAERDSQKDT